LAKEYGDATLAMNAKQPFGEYLTDSSGRALYMFGRDMRNHTMCYDACAQVWPPLVSEGGSIRVRHVDKSLVGLIRRKDGQMQVTYKGMPLYYYIKDKGRPGSTTGQNVHDKFGSWYLVAPTGGKVAAY
jgi:predicted lipoprotein with Yx(FWY)xxD motif